MYDINIWSVLIASVVVIVISSIWYSPALFGNTWTSLNGFKKEDIEAAKAKGMKGMWRQYLAQFIISLVMMIVLAFAIAITSASSSITEGAFVGFVVWLGFIATIHAQETLWLRKHVKLTLIDTLNTLVCLVIAGAILGA